MSEPRAIRVVAAVIPRGGRFLLTQRLPGAHMEGYWEFPGGKLEPDETIEEGLARELREELGVRVVDIRPLWVVTHDYPEKRVELNFLQARIVGDEPVALEVADLGWFTPGEMPDLPILPADLPIIAKLGEVEEKMREKGGEEGGEESGAGSGKESADDVDAVVDAEVVAEIDGEFDAEVVGGAPGRSLVRARGAVPAVGDPLAHYIEQVRRFEQLDRHEETALAERYRDTGDADAARRLVSANLMLVVKLALMYRRALRNVMDLIQEGNVGLLEALKRYDPEQGVRFSTYAAWWIKAYILKYLMDNARLVRVGTTNARRKLLYNLRREQRKLEAQGITATTKLLAERFGVTEDDVADVDRALRSPDLSVDAPLSEEGDFTVADVLPAPGASAEDVVVASDLKQRIDAAIEEFRADLDERERALLDGRLVAEDPLTLQELGDRFGVTREAMRQAEVKLKRRLATFLRKHLGDEVILHFTGNAPSS